MLHRDLHVKSEKLKTLGARFLLVGGVAAVIGALVTWAGSEGSVADALGVMLMWVAVVPTMAGIGLLLSGLTGGRVARERPFA